MSSFEDQRKQLEESDARVGQLDRILRREQRR